MMDVHQDIYKYLQKRNLATIATSRDNQPWCVNTYYAVSPNLSIYFVSSNEAKHSKDIQFNQNAALSVFDCNQSITSKKSGVQAMGIITPVDETIANGVDNHAEALDLWMKSVGGNVKSDLYKLATNQATQGTLYKFTPTKLRFLNEELYGNEIKTFTLDT